MKRLADWTSEALITQIYLLEQQVARSIDDAIFGGLSELREPIAEPATRD